MNSVATPVNLPRRCALILGAVGFAAGFLGPMLLNPESNIGPVIGILITGPAGAIAGAVLGTLFRVSSAGESTRRWILNVVAVVLALGTLYACLPSPDIRGYVIDADVAACESPAQSLTAGIADWQRALARNPSAAPGSNWIAAATANVEGDPGVVLTLNIRRKSAIFRHRRPWDRDRSSAGPWIVAAESKRFYAKDDGAACQTYLSRPRQLYWPAVDESSVYPKPSSSWPPTDTLTFLRLQSLGPVPAQYQRLLAQ